MGTSYMWLGKISETREPSPCFVLVEKELKAAGLTFEDISKGLANEFANRGYSSVSKIETSEYTTSGIKSKAAKEAAKLMLKKIKGIGEKAWNDTVKEYINKLPVSASVKKTLIAYTSYQFVMETLNVVIDFEGDITEAIEDYLMNIGFNSFFAGLIARTLVFLLL